MTLVAGLYKQCRVVDKRIGQQELAETIGLPEEKRRVEKEEMRKEAQDKQKKKRAPFDFEKVFFL